MKVNRCIAFFIFITWFIYCMCLHICHCTQLIRCGGKCFYPLSRLQFVTLDISRWSHEETTKTAYIPLPAKTPQHRCCWLNDFIIITAGQPIPMFSPAPKQTLMTSDFSCLDFGSGQDIVDTLAGWNWLPRTALLILSTAGQPEWSWVHYLPWVFPQQSELSAEESPEKLGTSQLHQRKVISLNKQILQKTKHLEEVSVFKIPLECLKLLPRGKIGRWMKSLVVDWSKGHWLRHTTAYSAV